MTRFRTAVVLKWLIALNILALVTLAIGQRLSVRAKQQTDVKEAQIDTASEVSMAVDATGIDQKTATRLFSIEYGCELRRGVSDEDLNWCLGLLKPAARAPRSPESFRFDVVMALAQAIPQMSAAQKDRYLHAITAAMALDDRKSPNWYMGVDVIGPIKALGALGDMRAVPVLTPYLHDPRSEVRKWTKQSLDDLGYKRPVN